MLKQLLSASKISALAIILSFGLSFVYAWTAPAELPPNGNTDAPINVGTDPQTKAGGLTVGDLTTASLRLTGGTPGINKVLTSDATGNATWQVGGSAGAGDNLGNHTATTSLNMAGFNVNNAANLINTSATAQTKLGALTVGGEVDVTGGTGTSYTTAPIEVRTTLTPRLAFHWPGVVASQIGMDSAGTIRTYDNPGTGYAPFAAGGITATGRLTVSEANGAYTYITLRDDESPSGVKYIHANGNLVGFLNSGGGWSSYWDNGNNQYLYGSLNTNDVYSRVAGKSLSQLIGGPSVYNCPVSGLQQCAETTCRGQLSANSTCVARYVGNTTCANQTIVNCPLAGRLVP